MFKLKLWKAQINLFFTKKRFVGNNPKLKKAILQIVILILAMYVWNDVINFLKDYQVNITHIADSPVKQ